jgi:hypothetical protein
MAITISSAVYVFVAATDSSAPARRSSGCWAAVARGEAGSLVIAAVSAPWRRASSITATMSGDWPDWLMPITSAPATRGGVAYRLKSEGAASATGSRARAPSAYSA